ncbi:MULTISPECIES: DUF523 domain-containing protein [unclassified Vibrio]|uniref:DUF523 domain-containing protein n=3 Tax=Vibrio TaxID=662 RepID=UPI000C850982|nr:MULTISPECIES: DUF523 domain-containing protein [unclassified Vibrio]CAK3897794.1 DUF523 domain-containing protein [Vibrio crassostreae]PMI19863.1 hypothetical protein BCU50_19235 [Vibrio sp. 10N.286.46.E10]PMI96100.1 hypothetical protein BCU34_19315 [Vibrio sp. 10N.286.45.E10]PTO94580.1 DUF523 domain-containing protein [Vibrio sp. 10N.286.45.A3]PTP11613.1 DUF523 domain-containing protein [Vibrio sp. 10N.286.51.C3]
MSKVLVSSCLLGCKVRYDGNDLKPESPEFQKFVEANEIVSFCPEVAGGLPTPRVPAEICGGDGTNVIEGSSKIMGKDGSDVTKEFLKGARLALKICQQENISSAILTDGSPSCGSSQIYNGKFEGTKVVGMGATTALLRQNGITVMSQHDVANSKNSLSE